VIDLFGQSLGICEEVGDSTDGGGGQRDRVYEQSLTISQEVVDRVDSERVSYHGLAPAASDRQVK